MTITEGTIGVQENVAGAAKKLDTTTVTQDASETTVHREAVSLADPEEALNRAGVSEDPLISKEYALHILDVHWTQILEEMKIQTQLLKQIALHLSEGSENDFSNEEL